MNRATCLWPSRATHWANIKRHDNDCIGSWYRRALASLSIRKHRDGVSLGGYGSALNLPKGVDNSAVSDVVFPSFCLRRSVRILLYRRLQAAFLVGGRGSFIVGHMGMGRKRLMQIIPNS